MGTCRRRATRQPGPIPGRQRLAVTGIAGFESMVHEEGQLEMRFTIAYLPRCDGSKPGKLLTRNATVAR